MKINGKSIDALRNMRGMDDGWATHGDEPKAHPQALRRQEDAMNTEEPTVPERDGSMAGKDQGRLPADMPAQSEAADPGEEIGMLQGAAAPPDAGEAIGFEETAEATDADEIDIDEIPQRWQTADLRPMLLIAAAKTEDDEPEWDEEDARCSPPIVMLDRYISPPQTSLREVRQRAAERERRHNRRAVEKKRARFRVVALALVLLMLSAVAAFTTHFNMDAPQATPAQYTLSAPDTVIDTVSVDGKYQTVAISGDDVEVIDFESEINQFLTDDNGFILYDDPLENAYTEEEIPDDLPEPEDLVEPTPEPTPTMPVGEGYAVISVDGAIVASLGDGADAQWLVDKLTENAPVPEVKGEIRSRGFVQHVEILTQLDKPETVIGRDEAYLLLRDKLTIQCTAEERVEEDIKYGTKYVDDSTLDKGLKKTAQAGKNGRQQAVYTTTYVDGKQTERKITARKVLEEAVSAVVNVGTKAVTKTSAAASNYEPGKVPLGENYPNIDKTLWRPHANEGIMGPDPGSLNFIYPTGGSISSYFGWRFGRMHYGIDIPNSTGTPVKASEEGTVTSYTGTHTGYGYIVELSHGGNFTTRYAHLSKILVTVGQKVKQGDVIGLVGSSGTTSSAPHLHFEIRNTDTPYNPRFYLDK